MLEIQQGQAHTHPVVAGEGDEVAPGQPAAELGVSPQCLDQASSCLSPRRGATVHGKMTDLTGTIPRRFLSITIIQTDGILEKCFTTPSI